MTPAQQAKAAGLKELSEIVRMIGFKPDGRPVTSLQTLTNWHQDKPMLFKIVVAGCVALQNSERFDDQKSEAVSIKDLCDIKEFINNKLNQTILK